MSGFRLLDLVKPFLPLLPEIETPIERVTFDDKVLFTVSLGFVYLLAGLPIYGLPKDFALESNPFLWLTPVFGAEPLTLLELGLLPVVTAGFVFQLLAGLKYISVNLSVRLDRELFQTAQKLLSIVLSIVYTVILLVSGYYPPLASAGAYAFVGLQVAGTGIVFTLLSEIMDKGYGFGSGALAFITLNVATSIVTDVAGLDQVLVAPDTYESRGVLVHLVRNILSSPIASLRTVCTRTHLANLPQVVLALATILVLIYFQNFRVELPIRSTQLRKIYSAYPVRLMFTGSMPILFAYTALFNIHLAGYFVAAVAPAPVATFVTDYVLYYLSPPPSLVGTLVSPIRTVVFGAFVVLSAVWFASVWSLTSGSAGKELAAEFKKQSIALNGKRDASVIKELNKVILTASVTGAALLAVISLVTEYLGGLGKGAAVVIAVGAGFVFLEDFVSEFQQGGTSQFASVLGGAQ
ncbi:hypothetical protein BABINDRAFT_163096 [Babjeviella inositovora NRRL Y-12698]|uniref:Translocon Sec61/SecY plug domain-containing protein n=1 Tax=Babjeviella inositovora NRRL Y-12698 TaxID=984486 RepID=A0A1E3QK55_9ASCO|nr:uncharacterized protein BABINDRAFT_163096 [Babjeviella inositovora NRRL Y-12698]ODQ78071.1 hypothetical protein BABINDRAFT_163096 [Babjeviella inositovora NRRL Y-12698]